MYRQEKLICSLKNWLFYGSIIYRIKIAICLDRNIFIENLLLWLHKKLIIIPLHKEWI